jgi:hypothetical protein
VHKGGILFDQQLKAIPRYRMGDYRSQKNWYIRYMKYNSPLPIQLILIHVRAISEEEALASPLPIPPS